MRILITGGAGYIGTRLIPLLMEKGHKVRVVDNLMFGGDQLLPFFQSDAFEFIKGDIRDKATVRQSVQGQDAVIHLAAIVGYPACANNTDLAKDVNVCGTKTLADHLSRDQQVVYSSTGSVYGEVCGICTEDSPLHPLSVYGQTKVLAERWLLENCTTIALRFATGFGLSPRMRLDLLSNDFVHKALTQSCLVVYEKHFVRTFIHVSDMARAFAFALEHSNHMSGHAFNVGSDQLNYSKQAICEMIQTRTACRLLYNGSGSDADRRNYAVSYGKINSLGYHTLTTVEQGIEELLRGASVLSCRNTYSNVCICHT